MALAYGPAAQLDQTRWVTSILQVSDSFPEEKVGEKCYELVFGKEFLETALKA